MFAAGINERDNRATLNDIQASTLQREAVVREIADRESKFDLSLEPSSYGLRISGIDVRYFAWQQRAQVRIDNAHGEFGLIVLFPGVAGDDPPDYKCGKEQSGGGKPAPG